MTEEIEPKEDKVLSLITYIDNIQKVTLTNKRLIEKREIFLTKLRTYKIIMGKTLSLFNKHEKEIDEEFEHHESIYFGTPIYNPVVNYKEAVKRLLLEKQMELDDSAKFIIEILEYAEVTKEQIKRIDETGMDFDEKKAFEEEILKFKRIYENPNATITEKKVSIKTIKDLITSKGQKELFRSMCNNTELQLSVLEGKKDETKRPKSRPKKTKN